MIIVETITGGVASRPHWNCSAVSFSRCMWSCVYKRRAYTCHHYFSYLASPCTAHPPLPLPIRLSSVFRPPLSFQSLFRSPSFPFHPVHSLSLSLRPPHSTRSLFFISKILSIRANKLHSLNSTLGSAVRKIKRFSVRLPAKEWSRE